MVRYGMKDAKLKQTQSKDRLKEEERIRVTMTKPISADMKIAMEKISIHHSVVRSFVTHYLSFIEFRSIESHEFQHITNDRRIFWSWIHHYSPDMDLKKGNPKISLFVISF